MMEQENKSDKTLPEQLPKQNEEVTDKKDSAKNPTDDSMTKKLTKEEQMELYEKDLKENDWGHRPC